MAKRQFRNATGKSNKRMRETQSTSSGNVNPGNKIFKPGVRAGLTSPKWKGLHPMTFRPLPCVDPETGDLAGTRYDEAELHAWAVKFPMVYYAGFKDCQQFSFVAFDPLGDARKNESNPYLILQDRLRQVEKTHKAMLGGVDLIRKKDRFDWVDYTSSKQGAEHFGCVPYIKWDWLIQGLVYQNDKEIYVDSGNPPRGAGDNDWTQVIALRRKTFEEILRRIWERYEDMENAEFDGTNEEEIYRYGNLVDPQQGKFITVFRHDTHKTVVQQGVDLEAIHPDTKGYSSQIHDQFVYTLPTGQQRRIDPNYEDKYPGLLERAIWDWDKLLYIPEHEELAVWLARAYKKDPLLLEYAWSDFPEFLTEEVNGILRNRTVGGVTKPAEQEAQENLQGGYQSDEEEFDTSEYVPLGDSVEDEFEALQDELYAEQEAQPRRKVAKKKAATRSREEGVVRSKTVPGKRVVKKRVVKKVRRRSSDLD